MVKHKNKTMQILKKRFIKELLMYKNLQFGSGTNRRFKLFKKLGFRCVSCGMEATTMIKFYNNKTNTIQWSICSNDGIELTIDHIIPRARGGKNSIKNYQPMCETCNSNKGASLNSKFFHNLCDVIGKEYWGKPGKKFTYYGIIVDIGLNPHSGKEEAVVIKFPNIKVSYRSLKGKVFIGDGRHSNICHIKPLDNEYWRLKS